jgi:acetyl esterase/lipase
MAWFFDCFLPEHDAEARRDPDVSPLYADLRDLPPALLSVGTLDPLLDDSLFLAARWRQAGGWADVRVYEGAPHGFDGLGLAVSRRANAARYEFVRRALDPVAAG